MGSGSMNDLLVTGAEGPLGHAVRALCPTATFVTRRDADLTDLGETRDLFDLVKPRCVLHLASVAGDVTRQAQQGADLFGVNVQINTNVLAISQQTGVERLISLLSRCAFPLFPDRPSTEDDLQIGMPFRGNPGYGYAKRMLDVHTQLLRDQHGCRFSTMTPVSMYGPHDRFDAEQEHVIGALIQKCYAAKTQGTPFEVRGSGGAMRQFVYAPDVARLLLRSLHIDDGPQTVIIAPDDGIGIFDLAQLVAQAMDYDRPPLFDRAKPAGVLVKTLRSRRFHARFKDFQFTALEQGLRETVAWFLSERAGHRAEDKEHHGAETRALCETGA